LLSDITIFPFVSMFNYSPHPDVRVSNSGEFFLSHHKLNEDGIVILADRDEISGNQLFEDYGDNEDKVYLQYHGFIPGGLQSSPLFFKLAF
jgi:hypothetical protein